MESRLLALEGVVRHRHFTRAAEDLQVDTIRDLPSGSTLERELGVELLRRTDAIACKPTEAGELVRASAEGSSPRQPL